LALQSTAQQETATQESVNKLSALHGRVYAVQACGITASTATVFVFFRVASLSTKWL
jgi:hypothetical protein